MAAPVSWGGTNSALRATAARQAVRKSAAGTRGMDTTSAECCRRAALRSGRKMLMASSPGARKRLEPLVRLHPVVERRRHPVDAHVRVGDELEGRPLTGCAGEAGTRYGRLLR